MKIRGHQKGFTLIEILLVVAAIAILAGIVVVAVNPAKQLAATRDSERSSEVTSIAGALSQAQFAEISMAGITGTCTPGTAAQEICKAAATGTCADGIALPSGVVPTHMETIPTDPTGSSTDGTGYYIGKTASGRITVCVAPETAGAPTISVTR